MGNLIGSIRNIIGAITGRKKATGSKAPFIATAVLLGVTGVFAYFANQRAKKLGGYIP